MGATVPTAELAVLAKTGIEVMEKASPPFATTQTDTHNRFATWPPKKNIRNHFDRRGKVLEMMYSLYLVVNFRSPEANVVILIVELTSSGASDVHPIKRLDGTGR